MGKSVGDGKSELTGDLAFYEERRTELERKYAGEYVAIVDRVVVDHDASFETLAARVFQKSSSPEPRAWSSWSPGATKRFSVATCFDASWSSSTARARR